MSRLLCQVDRIRVRVAVANGRRRSCPCELSGRTDDTAIGQDGAVVARGCHCKWSCVQAGLKKNLAINTEQRLVPDPLRQRSSEPDGNTHLCRCISTCRASTRSDSGGRHPVCQVTSIRSRKHSSRRATTNAAYSPGVMTTSFLSPAGTSKLTTPQTKGLQVV